MRLLKKYLVEIFEVYVSHKKTISKTGSFLSSKSSISQLKYLTKVNISEVYYLIISSLILYNHVRFIFSFIYR